MHLRSIVLKGFKSFPDRTRLDFSPGVSVIVGPNGSGKSNVTDAVLWALGEQSPLAVRGQTMQDVIFAGGHGLPSRPAAEVEVVIDNSGQQLASEFSEISIVRRLERSGDGEYRLNGARCRLVDVIEALSDTGLGKEMHSVVSQGRVEAIVNSRPRERRLLIEEAAGLGKHRKRRRRAQLKLERTEANLSRALDVEREARSRLRPLKRQAEAAELHERLARQTLEAELELVGDDTVTASAALAEREREAAAARGRRDEAERLLAAVGERRERAEEAFRHHSRLHEQRSSALHAARSAHERIAMRLERAGEVGRQAAESATRRRAELDALAAAEREQPAGSGEARIAEIERELSELAAERERRLASELTELVRSREAEREGVAALAAELAAARDEVERAERAAVDARAAQADARSAVEAARRAAAAVGADLAAVNQFLAAAEATPRGAPSLGAGLTVEPGLEPAVAAALGPLLRSALAPDLAAAERLLEGVDAGSAVIATAPPSAGAAEPPIPQARPLLDCVRADAAVEPVARRLLGDVWLVERLDHLPSGFRGVAVTPGGRVFFGRTGELRQAPVAGEQRVLEERRRRTELIGASAAAAEREHAAQRALDHADSALADAHAARDAAEGELRLRRRAHDEAEEQVRRSDWLIERRRDAPDEGPAAVRAAQLTAELRAERRLAEQAARERAARARRIAWLRERIDHDADVERDAAAAVAALERARDAVSEQAEAARSELDSGREVGERTAAELRRCAREEADLQRRLHGESEAVTSAEVEAQRGRDRLAEAQSKLTAISSALGVDPPQPGTVLAADERHTLDERIDRLQRRRAALGPVNPLAREEYEQAVEHVNELEGQRGDLERALAELQGLIRDADRMIRESFEQTFALAARNFEETVAHLFPGGRGRLRLVAPDGPRPVLGGEEASAAADDGDGDDGAPGEREPGVEIEVTPAGKATKRLSLMSGGEKSLVALAFLFAVFLARPCPFYILDEVEAALDDANIDRFLQLVRRFSDRAQFIIVTHQKRTMEAADTLYGVSMAGNGVSKVVSRRLPQDAAAEQRALDAA